MLLVDSVNEEYVVIVGFHDTAHHTPTFWCYYGVSLI
jgi:hypothetical protein